MKNVSYERLIVDSFENEFAMDTHFNSKMGNGFYVFRPYVAVGSRFVQLLSSIFWSFFVLFTCIFYPLFHSYLVRLRYKYVNHEEVKIEFSEKSKIVFENALIDAPCMSTISHDTNLEKIDLDVRFYKTYLKSVLFFIKKYNYSFWFYKSILLIPEMLAVLIFLEEHSFKKIHMTNQLDRWAYLLSSYANMKGIEVVMYQHGTVVGEFLPPLKITKVDALYAYNGVEVEFFNEHIIEEICRVYYMKPTISLYPIEERGAILLACSGSAEHHVLEVQALKLLLSSSKSKIFVKPHPNYKDLRHLKDFSCDQMNFIEDVTFFPDVDFLIHFGSTLAIEYSHSKKGVVIVHLTSLSSIGEDLKVMYN